MSKTNAGLIKNLLGLIQNGLFVTYKIEEVGGVLTGKHFETKEGLFNKPSCDSEQQRIDAMSASEIAEELEVLLNEITETNYDSALIDMYLEALEKKAPIPFVPDAESSYASFQKKLNRFVPHCSIEKKRTRHAGLTVRRVCLVAILTIISMLSFMVVAQAAGLDVFGTLAQWTDNIFSFGPIRSYATQDTNLIESPETKENSNGDTEYSSLQAALDAYGITDVHAPVWTPDGYAQNRVIATIVESTGQLSICAEYTYNDETLLINIMNIIGEPSLLIEKNNAPVESFEVNGQEVYLLENNKNNVATWIAGKYQCSIVGVVEKDELKQIVCSAYE